MAKQKLDRWQREAMQVQQWHHAHAAGYVMDECSPCHEPIQPGVVHHYESYPRFQTEAVSDSGEPICQSCGYVIDPRDPAHRFPGQCEVNRPLLPEWMTDEDGNDECTAESGMCNCPSHYDDLGELPSRRERTADGMLAASNEHLASTVRLSTQDTNAISARIAASPYRFVCPPEWQMTPHQLVALCRTAHPFWGNIAAGGMTLGGGLSAFFAGDAEATIGSGYEGWAFAAVALFGAAGWAKITSMAMRHGALKKLARLDLARVLEVRQSSAPLRAMAECKDPEVLSAYLSRPPREALAELWQAALDEDGAPVGTKPQPKSWADAAVLSMGRMTDQATDRVAALEGTPQPEPPKPSRWQVAREHFEAVEVAWEKIVCDPVAAIDHSALLDDISQPRTAAFHQAFSKAKYTLDRLTREHPDGGPTEPGPADVEAFEDQARGAAVAWKSALEWSEHVGYSWLPEEERGHVKTIRSCLALAADEEAGIGERITAAETATRLLKRIHSFVMPKQAVLAIEAKVRALPAGSSATAVTGQPILSEEPQRHEA